MELTPPMPETETPESLIAKLRTLLDVDEIDRDLYRGARVQGGTGRVFGGQAIGQALVAASRSIDDGRVIHSLHAYFLRPGDDALPILYRVVRDHDGRSFATRRVIAMQRGVPILNLAASFQRPEGGMAHQASMPDVQMPEELLREIDHFRAHEDRIPGARRRWLLRARPIEIRPVTPRFPVETRGRAPIQQLWFRAAAPLGDDPLIHRAVLAYASDMALLGTSMFPHGVDWLTHDLQSASLDHALWFHEDFRADEWLLYAMDSPWAGHGRGFNRGQIFTKDGRLVASASQEGLIRLRE